ncbi:MAG: HD domain-containing protein [Cyclobacteriaceae bacterium]|nr:HD domain-containing protein [Cyclobacteriaceae bacterium]
MNKKKIINDPLYGFISIPNELIYDIINHPFFQRLRRIKQLGMTDFVYPGALHTRFHHALGSMHLMNETIINLRVKGVEISKEEYNAALVAILLHDVGHSPFSHALENELVLGLDHEQISLIIMKELNRQFGGELDLAIKIFNGNYNRKFLHQLVSSQLDIDRLDYLNRDSFFTGVVEGRIGFERIIKLLNVCKDELVVEEKGIYSIENFLSARRLMYWQVYIHKTTVGIEKMLIQIIRRVRGLEGKIQLPPELDLFLNNTITPQMIEKDKSILQAFCYLDDYDILGGIKRWYHSKDLVLSMICSMLLERKLFNVRLSESKLNRNELLKLKERVKSSYRIKDNLVKHFVVEGTKSNSAYIGGGQQINMITKAGKIVDIAIASDLPNIKAMRKIVKKYYLCWPKNISLQS